ncbi:EamA family transporter, partial [Psychromonas aquatilis]
LKLNPVGMLAMFAALMSIVKGSYFIKTLGPKIHWSTVLSWQLNIGGLLISVIAFLQALHSQEQYLIALQNFNL